MPGGGLGYGVGGEYGDYSGHAFHLEIDTWHNRYNGTTELHTDPTEENHLAVLLDGNPADHLLWAEVPDIEDLAWHEVTVQFQGTSLRIIPRCEVASGA